MLSVKSVLAGVLFALFLLPLSGYGKDPKLTLLYKGKPLCYWNVTIGKGDAVYGKGVTDDHGVVVFKGAQMLTAAFDLKGNKSTANGNKSWSVRGMFAFRDDSYTATIEFADVAAQLASFMGVSEANLLTGWGISTDECTDYSKPAASSNNTGSNSGSSSANNSGGSASNAKSEPEPEPEPEPGKSLVETVGEMRAVREESQAQTKAQLEQQKVALEEKIARLNERVAKTKNEQAGLEAGTRAHSDKSYDLRDLELERDMAELELDRNVDERAEGGMLGKNDRQRYNDKEKEMQAEQKQLRKNRKDGLMYGQKPSEAAKENPKEEAEEDKEDNMPVKIYTPAELANMSSFDLKKTKVTNGNSINRRKLKLKTKSAFLSEEAKTKLKDQIELLEKQIESIKAVLAQRNEIEKEEKLEKETQKD